MCHNKKNTTEQQNLVINYLSFIQICIFWYFIRKLWKMDSVSEEQYLFFYWNVAIRKHGLFLSIIQSSLQKRQKLTVQIYWNYHSLQHLQQCIIDIQQWHWCISMSICFPLYWRILNGKTFPVDFLFWHFPETSPWKEWPLNNCTLRPEDLEEDSTGFLILFFFLIYI